MLLRATPGLLYSLLCAVLLCGLLLGCQTQASQTMGPAQTSIPASSPAKSPLNADYSQPQAVLDLFHQLILAQKWEDAYSLLSQDSKDTTRLGDFIQSWAANKGRLQLVKVEPAGDGQADDQAAQLYCKASWDQVYPKPGKLETYFVRSLVKENGAWRIRWRGPEDQSDLAHEFVANESQEDHDVTVTLERVVLLPSSTMIFFRLLNHSGQQIQLDPDEARLTLADGRDIPLETLKEEQLGPRKFDAGTERKDILFFRALEPTTKQVTVVSPQFIIGNEKRSYRFSVALS